MIPAGRDHWRAMAVEAARTGACGVCVLAAIAVCALVWMLAVTP